MPTDGPKTSDVNRKGGGSRKPTTTQIEVKNNMIKKNTTSGGPGNTGGKQGKYDQPY